MFKTTARSAPIVILLLLPGGVAAQHLPGHSAPETGAQAEWLLHTRAAAERSMQNWLNLAEGDSREEMAALFTDGGLLVDASGRRAEGRAAVRELLAESPVRSNVLLQVTGVTAGTRIMNVTGRVTYEESGRHRAELMTAVLELHRDYWMYRFLAFAPLPGGDTRLEAALAAGEAHTMLPHRVSVRVVLEPSVVRGPAGLGTGGDGWVGFGGSVGVELDRALELRATAWRGNGGSPSPGVESAAVTGFGAELRGYVLPAAGARPYLSLGLAKLAGPARDSAVLPHVGTGVALRLGRDFDLQLALRDYLVSADAALKPSAPWLTRRREHRLLFGIGVSFSSGRNAEWRDAELSPRELTYQTRELPGVISFVNRWTALVRQGSSEQAAAMYLPSAALLQPGGEPIRGSASVAAYWVDTVGAIQTEIRDARVSGAAAWVDLEFTAAGQPPRRVLTTLERSGGAWMIQNQVVH